MKRVKLIAIAGFLIVLALSVYSYNSNYDNEPSVPDKKTAANSAAETRQEEATSNSTVAAQIEEARKNGESMWLLFRSTTCIPCVEMQKVFDQLEPDYKDEMRFIVIDVDDKANADLIKSYKIQYIPTTFIIDSSGNVSYKNVGVIPTEDLKKELNKVVK